MCFVIFNHLILVFFLGVHFGPGHQIIVHCLIIKLHMGVIASHFHNEYLWPFSTKNIMHCCFQLIMCFLTTFLYIVFLQEPNIPFTTFYFIFLVKIVVAPIWICSKFLAFIVIFSWFPSIVVVHDCWKNVLFMLLYFC
jgi:hypothetical protein